MAAKNPHIADLLKTVPETPGVYRFFDYKGEILYIGKAKNLKRRVTSYFQKTHDNTRLKMLVRKIADLNYILVNTEFEALLLENNLIKEFKPKFNISLKDDKTYPWICIKKEPFPRVFPTRKLIRDGSEYFGPYASVRMMHVLIDLIRELYPLRTCTLNLIPANIEAKKFKVCLEFHMKRCKGPCEAKQTEESYNEQIVQIRALLKGHISSLIKNLKEKMKDMAAAFDFEEAQNIKDSIEALEKYQARSAIVSAAIVEADVFSIAHDNSHYFVNYMRIVNGLLIQSHTLDYKIQLDETPAEVMQLAVVEIRERFDSKAPEVILPFELGIETPGFTVTVPQRGEKTKLIELSVKNARQFMEEKHKQEKIKDPEKHTERIMEQMRVDLRLTEQPRHVECFDNSNIQGTTPVSACVVFRDGKPSKKEYRHFNIKTVVGPDDFASMEEVVFRRYKRMLDENEPLPQLIVIDGGKGQLSAAMNAIEKLELKGKLAIISIAKRLEEIYYPNDPLPLYIDKKSESLRVLQHMRNEAHRFGITHHRNKRTKAGITTQLHTIPGVGEKTANKLLRQFKSVKRIKEAPKEEIIACIGDAKANVLFAFFATEKNELST
ncbi:MAG: excinuclease ABC subunit UvrC [Flavobacteriales bacterium]